MSARRPWVRGELRWLGSGPLYRVHSSAREELADFLGRFSYSCIAVDGRAMTSRAAAHEELARAFDFPDYYGGNWDAFDECIADFAHEQAGVPVALVWDHIETTALVAPATAVEVGWALLQYATGSRSSVEGPVDIALDVFAIGSGDDFDRP